MKIKSHELTMSEQISKPIIGIDECLIEPFMHDIDQQPTSTTKVLSADVDYRVIYQKKSTNHSNPIVKQDQPHNQPFNTDDKHHLEDGYSLFCQEITPQLTDLCGYIAHDEFTDQILHTVTSQNTRYDTHCQFIAQHLQLNYPWIPIETVSNLKILERRHHFMIRTNTLHHLNHLAQSGLTRAALLNFHSCYKYLLLAHSQPLYRQIGPFVATIGQWQDLAGFFGQYRSRLMQLLAMPATTENHTNALMHMQGYFNRYLSSTEKQHLTQVILTYRQGELTLDEPIRYLKHYLAIYPNDYIAQQRYFDFYPTTRPNNRQSPKNDGG